MPAPAARMRSAIVPCGTTSSSMRPSRHSFSNTTGSAVRGNEQTILRTWPFSRSLARPRWPTPELLETTVRSLAPCSIRPSISVFGWPIEPKPPISTTEPSRIPAIASAMLCTILLIIANSLPLKGGGLGWGSRAAKSASRQSAKSHTKLPLYFRGHRCSRSEGRSCPYRATPVCAAHHLHDGGAHYVARRRLQLRGESQGNKNQECTCRLDADAENSSHRVDHAAAHTKVFFPPLWHRGAN